MTLIRKTGDDEHLEFGNSEFGFASESFDAPTEFSSSSSTRPLARAAETRACLNEFPNPNSEIRNRSASSAQPRRPLRLSFSATFQQLHRFCGIDPGQAGTYIDNSGYYCGTAPVSGGELCRASPPARPSRGTFVPGSSSSNLPLGFALKYKMLGYGLDRHNRRAYCSHPRPLSAGPGGGPAAGRRGSAGQPWRWARPPQR